MRWLPDSLERSYSLEEGDRSQKGDGEARQEASEKEVISEQCMQGRSKILQVSFHFSGEQILLSCQQAVVT